MLARRDVRMGICYVHEKARHIREVLEITREQKVVYNVFDMLTGNLLRTPHRICHKSQMIRWADREATPEECSGLKRIEANTIYSIDLPNSPVDVVDREMVIANTIAAAHSQAPVGYWCRVR